MRIEIVLCFLLAATLKTARAEPSRPTAPVADAKSASDVVELVHCPPGSPPEDAVKLLIERLARGTTSQGNVWDLVKPTDRLGIKIVAEGGDRRVVEAVIGAARRAGAPPSKWVVWDRSEAALIQAGFLDRRARSTLPGIIVKGIKPGGGYDPGLVLFAPAAGTLIWGDRDFRRGTTEPQVSNLSYLSFILTSQVDKVISISAARVSPGIGLHGAVAGILIDNADNWRRFHRPGGSEGLREAWVAASLDAKCILHIVDARVVQVAGGPSRNVVYERTLGIIAASRDPFALDARMVELIEPLALAARLPSPRRQAEWLLAPR